MESFELQDELNLLTQDPQNYDIPNERDFSSEDPTRLLEGKQNITFCHLHSFIHGYCVAAVEAVANSSDAIRDPEVFDVFRSVLKYSASVPGTIMNKVLDSITSGLQGEIEATMRDIESGDQAAYSSHRLPLELFAFLLQWFVTAAEKVKGKDDDGPPPPTTKGRRGRGGKAGGAKAARAAAARMEENWSWEQQIPPTLTVISKVLVRLGMHWQRVWTTTTEREAFVR